MLPQKTSHTSLMANTKKSLPQNEHFKNHFQHLFYKFLITSQPKIIIASNQTQNFSIKVMYISNLLLYPVESNNTTLLISNLSMEPQELPKDTLLGNTYRMPSVKTSEDELGLSNVNAQFKNIG